MKKFYFMSAALATMMAFAACNKTEVAPVTESEGALGLDEDIIEIAVSNTGIGTRATRPVLSSAADNNVNKVVLAFFDGTKMVEGVTLTAVEGCEVSGTTLTYTDADVEEGVPGDKDREVKTAKVKVGNLSTVAEKPLTVVAYGYNGDDFPYGTPTLKSDETYYEVTSLNGKEGTYLEEVFAGNTTATVTGNLGTDETPVYKFTSSVKIVLERQVAGMLAYFQNVPATINETKVAKITVEANGKSEGFYFPSTFLNTGNSGADAKKWMLNGYNTGSTASDVLLTFDLTDLTDEDDDNILDSGFGGASAGEGKKYTLANEMASLNTDNLVCKENTLFGGRYLIPYSAHVSTGYATLVVNFWAANDDVTPLKTMKVTTNQFEAELKGDKYHYDIYCNNFYSIGQKVAAGSTNGDPDPGDGEDPDPEIPDDPADLSASDELTVLINDAWEVIHNMELE